MIKNIIVIIILFSVFSVTSQNLVINEIMSSNGSAFYDEYNETPDWIEIYNPNSFSIELEDWFLSDDTENTEKWGFPDTSIQSNSYILIVCDALDTVDLYIHSNFKINSTGENITLYNETNLIDQYPPVNIENNQSFGRIYDGGIEKDFFYKASPSETNSNNILLSKLYFSHETGLYQNSVDLEISSSKSESEIYYTTNGNSPSIGTSYTKKYNLNISIDEIKNKQAIYSYIPTTPPDNDYYYEWKQPVGNIEKHVIIRAQSFIDSVASSNVITKSYFTDNYITDRFNTDILSIVTDSLNLYDYDTGIYVPGVNWLDGNVKSGNYQMRGDEWERLGHISLIDMQGSILLDKDVGLKIHGNLTRSAPQKSFKFMARNEIDGEDEFNIALFPDKPFTQYKHFLSRATYSSFYHDNLIHEAIKDLSNLNTQACKPVTTYINGEYWGLQFLREKIDKFYIEQYYNVDKDSIDMIFLYYAEEGNTDAYNELMNVIDTINMSLPNSLQTLESLIDIDNFIDYYCTELYFNNRDWPTNNVMFWRERKDSAKWRWLIYDFDVSMYPVDDNAFLRATGQAGGSIGNVWSYKIFVKLLESTEFEDIFISRYVYLVNNNFTYDKLKPILDEKIEIVNYEIQDHINRWGYYNSINDFNNSINLTDIFLKERACYVKQHIEEFFDISYVDIACEDAVKIVSNNDIKIFPNPCKDILNIETENKQISHINIYNILGEITLQSDDSNYNQLINTSQLEKGIYLISITFADSTQTNKEFVKH